MIKILTDSVASIPADMAKAAGVEVITLFVNRGPHALRSRSTADARDVDLGRGLMQAILRSWCDVIPTSSQALSQS